MDKRNTRTGNALKDSAAKQCRVFSRLACVIISVWTITASAQVPRPASVFGFEPGADYKIAGFDQMLDYYKKLDRASDRVKMIEIGKSVQGRPLLLLFISSEKNLDKLEQWRGISEKLSKARVAEPEARKLAATGKAIVWIDAGMHASEKACAQMIPELAFNLVTGESTEIKQIRDNVITMIMPVMNPDGLDIVAKWYKAQLGTKFETTNPPWLWHPYIGHDNNRDWFMNNMPESAAVSEVLYRQWYPQIVYNHHQSSPPWTRIFIPPFASPVNPNIHPGVTAAVNLLGTAMAQELAENNKPGVISQLTYDMWWNGGMRTVPYYHNQIGLLTEVAHTSPSPSFFDPAKRPANVGSAITMRSDGTNVFYSNPWKGGESHFRDPVEYTLLTSMAVLKMAAQRRESFLYNIYQMGRDAMAIKDSVFAYIIPARQWDKGESLNLVNILLQGGIEIGRLKTELKADGVSYPAGSYIIECAQSFHPYIKDLLEKQEYPDMRVYPGGPPLRPYDLAGWTLPMQMGVEVKKISSAVSADKEILTAYVKPAEGNLPSKAGYAYVLLNHENSAIKAVNRLLNNGAAVSVARQAFSAGTVQYPAGSYIIKSTNSSSAIVKQLASGLGLDFTVLAAKPQVGLKELKKTKIGIYKSWVANMDEGWTRWLLENYEFRLDTLHDKDLLSGDLGKYQAIIIPDQTSLSILNGHKKESMPLQYTGGMGKEGLAALKGFIEKGGRLITFDAASDFAVKQLALPLKNVTSELKRDDFYIPGSLIRMRVDTISTLASGMQNEVAASFNNSRAFEPDDSPSAKKHVVEVIASYAQKDLLMSGWAMGADKYIAGKTAVMKVGYGKGDVVLFAFSPQFRGQSRATYKLLFNALNGL